LCCSRWRSWPHGNVPGGRPIPVPPEGGLKASVTTHASPPYRGVVPRTSVLPRSWLVRAGAGCWAAAVSPAFPRGADWPAAWLCHSKSRHLKAVWSGCNGEPMQTLLCLLLALALKTCKGKYKTVANDRVFVVQTLNKKQFIQDIHGSR